MSEQNTVLISGNSVITAQVKHREAERPRHNIKEVTEITILAGSTVKQGEKETFVNTPLAKKTILGKYNQAQALAEFRRNPKTFTVTEFYPVAKALNLVP